METYTERVSTQLNELLEKTYDAEKGYKKAAENVDSIGLKSFFKQKADDRYNFGHELKKEIKLFGEQPDKGGSTTGDLHRAWMDTKNLLSINNEESMLEEAIRGEKASVEEYERVLDDVSIPQSTKSILENQRAKIESNLNTIKTLEDLKS